MPMIDALIPENALTPEAEARLLKEMTDILIRAEGYESDHEIARRVSFLFLRRPAAIFVGGVPSASPRYRVIPSVPEGQYTDAARETLHTIGQQVRHVLRGAIFDGYRWFRVLVPLLQHSNLFATSQEIIRYMAVRAVVVGRRTKPLPRHRAAFNFRRSSKIERRIVGNPGCWVR
jgi:hypothetical protein